jgi:tetratricopeptide (TPR) repeat protein
MISLYDSRTLRLLKSENYRGQRGSYLDIIHGMAEDIRLMLLPDSKPVTSVSGLAANSEAELLLRQGKFYTNRYYQVVQQADFDRAFSGLKRALDLDPKLADAAAGIAWLYNYKEWVGGGDQADLVEAEGWARRAIEIDPRCGRAWSALSAFEWHSIRPDTTKQLEYSLKAVRFAPREGESHAMLGNAQIPLILGLEANIEGYRLDSLDLGNGASIGFTLFCLGRSAEGLVYVDAILSAQPDFGYGRWVKFFILADLGRIDEAADLLPKPKSQDWVYLLPQCALALQRKDSTEADRLLKEILNRIHDPKARSINVSTVAVDLLSFLVRHGRMEAALDILKRDLEAGYYPLYDMLVLDPRLEPLRRDAHFQPILEKYRENCVAIMKVLAQARSRGELPRFLDAPFLDLLKKLDIKL